MNYAFYVCVEGKCRTTVVDIREFDWTEEIWNEMDVWQQTEALQQIFEEYQSNLCDSGWYPVKDASEVNSEELV